MSLPYATDSCTSQQAAEFMADKAKSVAERIWWFAVSCGTDGVTSDEVKTSEQLGIGENTVNARMRALKYSGLLVRHPQKLTRRTRTGCDAEVWVARLGLDFTKTYREPPPRDHEAEAALMQAAQYWAANPEDPVALDTLLDRAWATVHSGPRPKPDQDDLMPWESQDDLFTG